jgi:hypothetical protein
MSKTGAETEDSNCVSWPSPEVYFSEYARYCPPPAKIEEYWFNESKPDSQDWVFWPFQPIKSIDWFNILSLTWVADILDDLLEPY